VRAEDLAGFDGVGEAKATRFSQQLSLPDAASNLKAKKL